MIHATVTTIIDVSLGVLFACCAVASVVGLLRFIYFMVTGK